MRVAVNDPMTPVSGYVLCLTGGRRLNKRTTIFVDSFLTDGYAVRVLSVPRGPWSFGLMEVAASIHSGRLTADVGDLTSRRISGIVCFHWILLPLAVLIGCVCRTPVIYDEHDHYELNTLEATQSRLRRVVSQQVIRGIHRIFLSHVTLVTCIHMHRQLLKRHLDHWGCDALEMHNYPTVVWRESCNGAPPAGPVTFVYIGGVYAVKGVRVAADAFCALPEALRRSAELHIFGDGDPELIRYLQTLPSVSVHHEVEPAEFREFAVDRRCCGLALLVDHPRYNLVGTNCTKLYEYLAMGMPVLGTNVGEFPEFILDHQVGCIVNSQINLDELSAAMARMISQPRDFLTFAANARQLMAHSEMTWESEWQKLSARNLMKPQQHCPDKGV